MSTPAPRFVVAAPNRTTCDHFARVLEQEQALRLFAIGTRRGIAGVPPERTRLNPLIGLTAYIAARTLSTYWGEHVRFSLLPWFDHWVKSYLRPGDHMISSYGYTTECFRRVRAAGGRTFMEAGNSHLQNFWDIMQEEHRRWGSNLPPFAPIFKKRALEMIEHTDYVLSPSSWVTDSFLARGFPAERILKISYPVDLSCFTPAAAVRPADRPLTIISTGQVSLRKGTPYLLEAYRLIRREAPEARLLLTESIADSVRPVLAKHSDLPIEWAPPLPHPELAERLRGADVFVLPSLEEGRARTVIEAMACGLPVVVTHSAGATDLVQPGVSGTIVPIRDPEAIARAVLEWWEKLRARSAAPVRTIDPAELSHEHLRELLTSQLRALGVL